MTVFSYKAATDSGAIVKGTIESPDEKNAAEKLQEMGYLPIQLKSTRKVSEKSGDRFSFDLSSLFSRISGRDVTLFTSDFSSLLAAGIPIDRALSIEIDIIEKKKFRETIRDVLKSVQGGSYFSDALARHPKVFSEFFINMVRAGESGGVLEAVLERLAIYLEDLQNLKDEIRSALYYPVFLIFVGGISIIVLLTYVIPKFAVIFADMGSAIPLSTRVLLGVSGFLKNYWWGPLGLLILFVVFFRKYMHSEKGRSQIDKLKLTFPFLGDLFLKIETARFARTLGTLIKSGVPILSALDLVRDVMGNVLIKNSLVDVQERVREGDRLSKPLAASGVFPSMAVQMVTVGEEAGQLDEMLLKLAENYEKTIRIKIKNYIGFLEPAMILVMGIVVGFIVISMLTAIFSMNQLPF